MFPMAGSRRQHGHATTRTEQRCSKPWTAQAKHSLNPKSGLMPVAHSPRSHTIPTAHTHHPSSEFSCSAACGFHSLCLPATAGCRRALDFLGDHRAACPQSGVLRSRGGPLERAAARICCERPGHESPPTPEWQT